MLLLSLLLLRGGDIENQRVGTQSLMPLLPALLSLPVRPSETYAGTSSTEYRIPQRDTEDLVYTDFASLQQDFKDGKIHPGDLKVSVQNVINKVPSPL